MAANANNGTLFRTEEGKKTFLNPETNQIYQIGDLFKQPFAAEFLGNISSLGVDYVYRFLFFLFLFFLNKRIKN